MSYKVIQFFTDLQDNNHAYHVGDEFPRHGMEVSDVRLAELASTANKQHKRLIEKVEGNEKAEEQAAEETSESDGVYTAEMLEELSVTKIKALAEQLGYKITKIKRADVVEEFLSQQK